MSDVLVFDTGGVATLVEPAQDVVVIDIGGAAQFTDAITGDLVVFDLEGAVTGVSAPSSDFLIIDSPTESVVEMDTGQSDFMVITSSGLTGPIGVQGVQGIQGIRGLPGDPVGAVAYTFDQLGSSALWDIPYPLDYEPAVAVVDTSGGEIGGDVRRLALGHLQIAFSLPVSGTAYLS